MAVSPPPGELYAYEPPVSLWALVESHVPGHEQEEIKNLLGESLVDQSLELHREVETLLEIWRDYREETQQTLLHHRLPEPPAARDRLKQEIIFFFNSIQEKAKQNGRNTSEMLHKNNNDVLQYALDEHCSGSLSSRPSTARSGRDGRETPMARNTPDRLSSQASTMSEDVDTMNDRLNVLRLDEVLQHLRDTLNDEVQYLLGDIEFLQHCLDNEADFRSQTSMEREPTLTDLREERSKLEKVLLTKDESIPMVLREKTQNVASPPVLGLKYNAGPEAVLKVSPPSGVKPKTAASRPVRSSPLKATHSITPSAQVLTFNGSGPQNTRGRSKQASTDVNVHTHSPQSRVMKNKGDGADAQNALQVQIGNEMDVSHITIRTKSSLHPGAKLVKMGSIPVQRDYEEQDSRNLVPSPPLSEKPVRPTSAQRFRRMVLNCRDGK